MFNKVEHYLRYNIQLHHIVWASGPHMYYNGGSKPQYTMMSLQNMENSVMEHNTILCNVGYRDQNLRSSSKSIVTSTTPTM